MSGKYLDSTKLAKYNIEDSFIELVYNKIEEVYSKNESIKLPSIYDFLEYAMNRVLKSNLFIYAVSQSAVATVEEDGGETKSVEFIINDLKTNNDKLYRIIASVDLALFNSKKIFIISSELNTNTTIKTAATELEKSLVENGTPYLFIDLKVNETSSVNARGTAAIGDTRISSNKAYLIFYNELNTGYRELLSSSLIEIMVRLQEENITNLYRKALAIDSSITSLIRQYPDDEFFITDKLDDSGNVKETNRLHLYLYSNAYMARRAVESDIIAYYRNDNYISNGYGTYIYQSLEIDNFMAIFRETRQYFYQVLLNESFINEDNYSLYEKTFLIFFSIVRFMASKLDNSKNIDLFDRSDIINFLETFGMSKLSGILEVGDFINSEQYAKKILKRYVSLVQKKGSRDVIDILENVFTLGNTELKIFRTILAGIRGAGYDIHNRNYQFIKVDYDDEHIIDSMEDSKFKYSLSDYTLEDKYWNAANTNDDLLNSLNLSYANTKYIIPEITVEVSRTSNAIRVLLALIDYFLEKLGMNDNDNNITITLEGTTRTVTLYEYLNILRTLWKKFIDNYNYNVPEGSNGYFYTISEPITGNLNFRGYVFTLRELYSDVVAETDYESIKINKEKVDRIFETKGYDDSSNVENFLDKIKPYVFLENIPSTSIKIPDLVKSMLELSASFYSGARASDNMSGDVYGFLLNLYSSIFKAAESENPLYSKADVEDPFSYFSSGVSEDDPSSIMVAISSMTNKLSEVEWFRTSSTELFAYSISSRDTTFMRFLKFAIEYFISYTSEVYKYVFNHSYNSKEDGIYVRDSYEIEIKHTDIDSFYYDESLKITTTEINEQQEV